MRKKDMERLAAQIAGLDRSRRAKQGSVDERRLTSTERAFFALADQRGKRVLRNGWPDFLVTDESGASIGVEVKSVGYDITPAQELMFGALEAAGLRIVVWHPNNPGRLVPWQRFYAIGRGAASRERRREAYALRTSRLIESGS